MQALWTMVDDPRLREVVRRLEEQIEALRKQVNKGA